MTPLDINKISKNMYVPAKAIGIDRLSFIGVYSSAIVAINTLIIDINIFSSGNKRTIAKEVIRKDIDPSRDFLPIIMLP